MIYFDGKRNKTGQEFSFIEVALILSQNIQYDHMKILQIWIENTMQKNPDLASVYFTEKCKTVVVISTCFNYLMIACRSYILII